MNVSGMKNDYEKNQNTLSDLLDTMNNLNGRIRIAHSNITLRSEYYRGCSS